MDRRTLLRRAALLGAVGLAGCTGDGGDGTTDGADEPTDGSGAPSATTEATTTTAPETTDETTSEMATTDGGAETTTATPEGTDGAATSTADPTSSEPQESVTVAVGADGKARFSPESFTLVSGGTVTWEWEQGGHNVLVDSQPEGGGFENLPGGQSDTQDAGFSYSQTFDTPGEYSYYCSVHRGIGMEASFTVE
ncbi:plastocyanin/azurin family copper-binding protein [Halomarina salina]|uniref:Plastocyanin/azurin family copper-binding protein n=1 Tax=Halomarina salina TaxID=1872699 RepID=A0ABD5RNZ1_9EURY|nr:plastocyanin/azurin family copper-binding protein [Halomarina salina]